MSSKKHRQAAKPANEPEAVADDVSSADSSAEPIAPEVESPSDEADESAAEQEGEPLPDVTFTSEVEAAEPSGLHARLVEAARIIPVHAGQERFLALNQAEILIGRLKLILPAAVEATDEEGLRAGLHFLLSIL